MARQKKIKVKSLTNIKSKLCDNPELSEDFINLIDGMEGIFIEAPIITTVLDEDEEEILVYKYNIYKLDNNDNVLDETWIYSID